MLSSLGDYINQGTPFFGAACSFGGTRGVVPVEAFVEGYDASAGFGGIPDCGVEGEIGGAEGVDRAFGCGVQVRKL